MTSSIPRIASGIAHVLANLDGPAFDIGATNVAMTNTATGGRRFDAKTLTAAATVEVHSANGHTFIAKHAQLELDASTTAGAGFL